MRLYMLRTPIPEILEETGISIASFDRYRLAGKWVDQRKEIESEAESIILRECKDVALVNKRAVMVDDLEIATKLRDAIKKAMLNNDGQPMKRMKARDLDLLAKAAKNVSDISTRIVGLHEEGKSASGNTINIGIAGRIPEAHEITISTSPLS